MDKEITALIRWLTPLEGERTAPLSVLRIRLCLTSVPFLVHSLQWRVTICLTMMMNLDGASVFGKLFSTERKQVMNRSVNGLRVYAEKIVKSLAKMSKQFSLDGHWVCPSYAKLSPIYGKYVHI